MKTIAENANDFASIRTMDHGNCIYVDKTDYFHRLVTAQGKNLFFISRPRRFGKSLMLSTLKCIFEGRRELFKGLKIEKKRWDWQKKWPVVMLNMADVTAASVDELKEGLTDTVDELVRTFVLKDVVRLSNPGKYLGNFLKAKVAAEEGSARGYADAIIETKKFVWVFEFKFNKSAKAAVAQIRENGYADQYRGDVRPVTLVGVNFRTAKRNIDEPLFAAL